jgi:hypothetical protein
MMKNKKEGPSNNQSVMKYAGMGFQFLAACLIGFLLGQYLDGRGGKQGQSFWTAICTVTFMVAVMVNIFLDVLRKK